MSTEIQILGYAALLQFAQLIVMAVPVNLQLGPKYTAGPRDEERRASGVGGRLKRAMENHFEALVLFTIAVLVVEFAGASTALTVNCAWAYLIARILYVPAYVSGIYMLRTLIWAVGFFATLVMLVSTLL